MTRLTRNRLVAPSVSASINTRAGELPTGIVPLIQNTVPSSAASQNRPQSPTMRSATTDAIEAALRSKWAGIRPILTISPPTEPGRNVLKKKPISPRRKACPHVMEGRCGRIRTYHRRIVQRMVNKDKAPERKRSKGSIGLCKTPRIPSSSPSGASFDQCPARAQATKAKPSAYFPQVTRIAARLFRPVMRILQNRDCSPCDTRS